MDLLQCCALQPRRSSNSRCSRSSRSSPQLPQTSHTHHTQLPQLPQTSHTRHTHWRFRSPAMSLPAEMSVLLSDVREDKSFLDFSLATKPTPTVEGDRDIIIRMEACPIK